MELHAFSDERLTSIAQWQSGIDAERFALTIDRRCI
jgi:hypothetical protein